MPETVDYEAGLERLLQMIAQRHLPAVTRAEGEAAPALLVADRQMAALIDAQTLALSCPISQKVLLMDISPNLYFETEQQVGQDTILVRLDRIADEELSLRLHDAWEYVAPDRLKRHVD